MTPPRPSPWLLTWLPLILLAAVAVTPGGCAPQTIGALGDAATTDKAGTAPEKGFESADAMPTLAPAPKAGGCDTRATDDLCLASPDCRWLVPGCGDAMRALPRSGCFAKSDLNCASDAACSGGKRCATHDINPCYQPSGGGGVSGIGGGACAACGMIVNLCL
jgi:hypothetical protein